MPRKPETDPEVLAARRKKKRDNHARYMKLWRQQGKRVAQSMTHLLESAAANRPMPIVDPESPNGLTQRSAAAALGLSLSRHSLTLDRSLSVISEGHDSTKLRVIDGKEVSQPDMPSRLRAAEQNLRLLERSGGIPADRRPEVAHIHVQVLMMGDDPEEMRTIDAEKTDE